MIEPGLGLLLWILGMDLALVLWNLAQYIEAKRGLVLLEIEKVKKTH
jgi:hypothetical protein